MAMAVTEYFTILLQSIDRVLLVIELANILLYIYSGVRSTLYTRYVLDCVSTRKVTCRQGRPRQDS